MTIEGKLDTESIDYGLTNCLELNAKITRFLEGSGRCLSKDEWLREYPEATETE